MRIAVNTRLLLKDKLEGIGWYAHEVLRRLVQQHPNDEFIFFFDRPYSSEFIFGTNVTPVVLFPPARHPFLFIWWFEWSVARALGKWKPDVFLSPDNFLTLRTNIPTVLVTHDLAHAHFPDQLPFFQRWYYGFFTSRFNKKADRIVTVSQFTKTDLQGIYNIEAKKISVSYNGCKEGFMPLSADKIKAIRSEYTEGLPYFLYVGAIHPRKNVHRLISAFDNFKKATGAPVKLLIVGRFAWKGREVLYAFRNSNYQQDIRFLGYVDYDKLPELTGAAFCSTFISSFEGFGVPVLEAMRCDVPVITSNVSSMPEVAGEAALLVNPESIEEISFAMQRIYEDNGLRKQLIEKGREQSQKFKWQGAADIVYENLLLAARQQ